MTLVVIILTWALMLGAVIAVILFLTSRSKRDRGGALRRFFRYGTLYLLAVITATGLSGLFAFAGAGTDYRAFMLSFVIVGAPGLALAAGWVRRALRAEGGGAPGWEVYLTAAELTGLLVGGGGVIVWGQRLSEGRFDPAPFGVALVWGMVWLFHHMAAARRVRSARLEGGFILGSLAGLAAAAGFGVAFLDSVLQIVYDGVWGVLVLDGTGDAVRGVWGVVMSAGTEDVLRESAVGLAVSGAAWSRYWLRLGRSGEHTPLWRGYVLLAGVVGGLVTGLAGVWSLGYRIFDWLAGGPVLPAGVHFGELPLALALAAVGGGLWRYHRGVLRSAAGSIRTEVDRVYEYTVSGVGLLAAVGGLTAAAAASIQSFTSSRLLYVSYDRSGLIAAATVLAVGGPLWWRFWSSIQRRRAADPGPELRSPNRRIYLVCLFGVGGLAALISLLVLVYEVLISALEQTLDAWTLYTVRWPLALTAVVGLTAAYHRAVRRADLSEAPEADPDPAEAARKAESVVLLCRSGGPAARTVRERTGAEVQVWERPDAAAALSPDGLEAVIQAVENSGHRSLLAVARPDGVEIIPYEAAES